MQAFLAPESESSNSRKRNISGKINVIHRRVFPTNGYAMYFKGGSRLQFQSFNVMDIKVELWHSVPYFQK
ncbi:hypothetical protein PHAVU_009G005400 [Phaseolus vulgaris]|uniref:Uncharacterized protein n=1 Tax=Phaseolus vulgaris TaxID=3885 RepID=V7AQL3_PHAVU|nr:hypothetical protein PHAVU_009G005400g [Phaseolus vulgaris]ESW07942.1 hypothetical protein PHAVU_009G005400g [Phaseolus vulgaris]